MENTVMITVSDGSNSYRIPHYLEDSFDADAAVISDMDEETDDYYELCAKFDETWGEYQI